MPKNHLYGPLMSLGRGRDARDALAAFQLFDVDAGTVLTEPGDRDDSLIVVGRGRVDVSVGELQVGQMGPGQLVGEICLFADHPRTSRAVAATPCDLLVIDRDGFDKLLRAGNSVASGLQRVAMTQLGQQRVVIQKALAKFSEGKDAPEEPSDGMFGRLANMFGMVPQVREARADAVKVLRSTPLFSSAPPSHVEMIAEHMDPVQVDDGALLFAQSRVASRWFLLTKGDVEIVVSRSDDDADTDEVFPVAEVGRGAVIGLTAIMSNAPHAASAIARSEVSALAVSTRSWSELSSAHQPYANTLRQALLRALCGQVVETRRMLLRLQLRHRETGDIGDTGVFRMRGRQEHI